MLVGVPVLMLPGAGKVRTAGRLDGNLVAAGVEIVTSPRRPASSRPILVTVERPLKGK
jgi:hypothetical protein